MGFFGGFLDLLIKRGAPSAQPTGESRAGSSSGAGALTPGDDRSPGEDAQRASQATAQAKQRDGRKRGRAAESSDTPNSHDAGESDEDPAFSDTTDLAVGSEAGCEAALVALREHGTDPGAFWDPGKTCHLGGYWVRFDPSRSTGGSSRQATPSSPRMCSAARSRARCASATISFISSCCDIQPRRSASEIWHAPRRARVAWDLTWFLRWCSCTELLCRLLCTRG
eukprot:COSAG01_NODE_958_length_12470_cov_52.097729_7_plen_225_part_00